MAKFRLEHCEHANEFSIDAVTGIDTCTGTDMGMDTSMGTDTVTDIGIGHLEGWMSLSCPCSHSYP